MLRHRVMEAEDISSGGGGVVGGAGGGIVGGGGSVISGGVVGGVVGGGGGGTDGYKMDQYSKSSIQYLEWVSRCDGVKKQHALNGGEERLPRTRYKLDGYCQEMNTAYEFHGCVFHGCTQCFPEDREETKHPLTR